VGGAVTAPVSWCRTFPDQVGELVVLGGIDEITIVVERVRFERAAPGLLIYSDTGEIAAFAAEGLECDLIRAVVRREFDCQFDRQRAAGRTRWAGK
jgi:hypothetical protein